MRIRVTRDEMVKAGSGPLRVTKGQELDVEEPAALKLIECGTAVPANTPVLQTNIAPSERAVFLKVGL